MIAGNTPRETILVMNSLALTAAHLANAKQEWEAMMKKAEGVLDAYTEHQDDPVVEAVSRHIRILLGKES